MKKRYLFSLKNCFCFPLMLAFAVVVSPNVHGQTAPAVQWSKTFGGYGSDQLWAVCQTADGGYIVGGISNSGISATKSQASKGAEDYWIVKLDAAGNKQWDKTLGGSEWDQLYALQQTSDGGYILGGISVSNVSGDKSQQCLSGALGDYWVIKLDANGNTLWDKTIGGNNEDYLFSLQQTTDGGFILGGTSNSGISGHKSMACKGLEYFDYWVVKLDANGTKLWDKTIGGYGGDVLWCLQQTTDGGYILGGYSDSGISFDKTQASQGSLDFWVIKLDGNGNISWDRSFGGSDTDEIKSLIQTMDGGYLLGGVSKSGTSSDKSQPSQGSSDFWVVKLNAAGDKQWDKTLGGTNDDILSALTQTPDGGYILGGESKSGISGDKTQALQGIADFWVVKLDASGNKTWDRSYGGINARGLTTLKPTSDGGLVLGGNSFTSNTNIDYEVIKLAGNVTGTQETQPSLTFTLSPNPSHGKFHLHLTGLTAPTAEVTITDLLGRVVLKQEFRSINNQLSEEINLPNANGMYLLELKSGGQTTSRKVIVE